MCIRSEGLRVTVDAIEAERGAVTPAQVRPTNKCNINWTRRHIPIERASTPECGAPVARQSAPSSMRRCADAPVDTVNPRRLRETVTQFRRSPTQRNVTRAAFVSITKLSAVAKVFIFIILFSAFFLWAVSH